MKIFFDLADADGSGGVSQEELYDVLKVNANSAQERAHLKKTIKDVFEELDDDKSNSLSRDEFMKMC